MTYGYDFLKSQFWDVQCSAVHCSQFHMIARMYEIIASWLFVRAVPRANQWYPLSLEYITQWRQPLTRSCHPPGRHICGAGVQDNALCLWPCMQPWKRGVLRCLAEWQQQRKWCNAPCSLPSNLGNPSQFTTCALIGAYYINAYCCTESVATSCRRRRYVDALLAF